MKNGGVTTVNRMLQPTKSSLGQPTKCVTQPSRQLHTVNPKLMKVNAVQSSQKSRSKKSMQQGQSQCSTSVCVPINAAFKNRTFGDVWRSKDQVLTKVNADKTCAETLDRSTPKSPTHCSTCVRRKCLQM